ncbi:MAG: GNAT family N-acetyltransferase [Gammaproteobacteria bacterium]
MAEEYFDVAGATVHAIASIADRPELRAVVHQIFDKVWTPTLMIPSVSSHLIPRLVIDFSKFVLVAVTDDPIEPLGYAAAIPFVGPNQLLDLPDGGYDEVFTLGVQDFDAERTPTMLAALAIAVMPKHRGSGVSEGLARALCTLARSRRFSHLVVPVRPAHKAAEPFVSMEKYALRTRPDGAPADPWIRLHWRLGAAIIKICPSSMTMHASITAWEKATGMLFPTSGLYAIPDGLAPLRVDCERGLAVLIEPNVWMDYAIR